MMFMDLFEQTNKEHFEKLFNEFYREQHPDLKNNDRIHDLMTAYNNNSKLLIQNLNDYEKIMNVKI